MNKNLNHLKQIEPSSLNYNRMVMSISEKKFIHVPNTQGTSDDNIRQLGLT